MADLVAALKIAAPHVDAAAWGPALTAAFSRFGLDNHRRVAAAVGQFMAEAGGDFGRLEESLWYAHAARIQAVFGGRLFPTLAAAQPYVRNPERLANHVYANRNGNGDEGSGDGFRFRGGGLIQLTGRTEFARFGASIGKSPEAAAQYCETAAGAAMSGCWYLAANGCLPLADAWDIDAITRAVNRRMLAAAQRLADSNAMLAALGG